MYPFIEISPAIIIPTYYLMISLAMCVSLFWVVRRAQQSHLSRNITLDVSLIIMVSGLIGSRLLHIIFENPTYYLEDWWRIFDLSNGGFVFYGGALLAAMTAIPYLHIKTKGFFESYLDLFAPVSSLAYALGRSGCFLAGCCYGKYCELPWAINNRHPTQLYAVFWELGVLLILLGCERIPAQSRRPTFLAKSGSIFYLWMILHSTGRLLMETYRDDFRGPTLGLSISSWISLFIILLGAYLIIRKPAVRSTARST